MRAVSAIFQKQLSDFPKNVSIVLMYILYPVLAFVMGNFMGEGEAFVITFAMMFAGAAPMITIANTIAEDNEYKSLRFLIMAGVKPHQYILGLALFVLVMSVFSLLAFVLIGGFSMDAIMIFMPLGLLICLVSCVLGGVVGIFSKNVQQSAAIYTPLMLVITFVPFIGSFNETIGQVAHFLFTQQFVRIMAYIVFADPYASIDMLAALIIIAGNLLAFGILFAIAYKKKGLKG